MHFSVGLRKNFEAGAKKSGCGLIREWLRSIINHLYWCGAFAKLIWLVQSGFYCKITSLMHPPSYLHGDLSGQATRKKWFRRHKIIRSRLMMCLHVIKHDNTFSCRYN